MKDKDIKEEDENSDDEMQKQVYEREITKSLKK